MYRLGPRLLIQNGGVTMRMSENALKNVVFFGVPSAEPGKDHDYGGTGFLVGYSDGPGYFGYLVTARHVAKALEKYSDTGFVIRANTMDGASIPLPIEHVDWAYPKDDRIDLAATPFSIGDEFDQIYFGLKEGILDFSHQHAVQCGDRVCITGLFRLYAGTKRNVAIVHTGHVAALADPKERVPLRDRTTGEIVEAEVYLVEAQTLDGLSGSPVYIEELVNLGGYSDLPEPGQKNRKPMAIGRAFLMGLYVGSWDGEPGTILAADRGYKGSVRVPVGMGLVVSAAEILKLIEGDERLKAERENTKKQIFSSVAAVADSALPDPRASDVNPTHREDFTRLLGAAARKPPQED